jgi:SPP1 gp7 family putative phage head morphogenesis protein
MATVNEEIRDQLLAHQVELIRFGKGMSTRIVRLLDRAEPELRAVIRARLDRIAHLGFDPGPATTARMIRTSKLIGEISKPTFQEINQLVRRELVGLSIGETQFIAGVFNDTLPVLIAPALPTARELRGIVFARPFENRILRDWLATYRVGDQRRMMDQIRQGLVFDETPTQIGRRIFGTRALGGTDGTREITRRGAQTLASTSISAISNATRQEFYKKNRRFVKSEVYTATLDSRTTPICSALDGQIFPVGLGSIPPLHINCRSIRVPVVDGRRLGTRPSVAATERQLRGLSGPERRRALDRLVGRVPAETNYQQWLGQQTVGFQDEVLGPTRGILFRKGEIDLPGFIDASGTRHTLRELYDIDPRRFQRAGVPAPAA